MDQIVPTEQDDFFRKELLRGFVHDEGASMMGGVSGHAGLFGSTNDLAKIMQMYLQYGRYGGEQILDSASVREFTRIQYPQNQNRRGLGFDKPYIDNHKKKLKEAYPAVDASPQSFGHSGFTGTFTWADPKNNLLFVFCSNRVNPTRNNSKVYDLNIRPAMHQAIYDSLKVRNL
jgi:CubicO group peptidase (beta-lactamase class C family)